MSEDYRVPVARQRVQAWLVGGQERDLELFFSPDVKVASLLDDGRLFLPALDGGRVCLVAREALVALRIGEPEAAPDEEETGLPMSTRRIAISLSSGRQVSGDIRFVASGARHRTADFLNDAASYLTVHSPEDVIHIVKRHIVTVVED